MDIYTYEPDKVGKRISWLGEHSVHLYDHDQVIKFSRLTKLLGKRELDYVRRDIEIGERYFGEYMVPTRVATLPGGTRPVLLQPFVRGRILRRVDLANPSIAAQYKEIVRRNNTMLEDGHPPIDLMSGLGFLLGVPRNLFLVDNTDVRIIDVTSVEMLTPLFRRWIQLRQKVILDRYVVGT